MTARTALARYVVPLAVTFFVTMGLGSYCIWNYSTLSPIDELQHLDYVIKAGSGQFVLNPGELIGEDAMRIEACRGIDAQFTPPSCDAAELSPEQFQEMGINTAADGIPSPYYIMTGVIHLPLTWIGLDALDSARTVSLFWHALGATAIALIIISATGSAFLGGSLGTLTGVLPHVLSQSSTTNPDSWALLAGSCFAALAIYRSRLTTRWFLGLCTLATLACWFTKPNWILLLGIPALAVFTDALVHRSRDRWLRLLGVIGVGALTASLQVLLVARSARLAVGQPQAPMDVYLRVSDTNPFERASAVASSLNAFVPFNHIPVVDPLSGRVLMSIAFVWGVVLSGGAVMSALNQRFSGDAFNIGLAGALILLLSPLMTYLGQFLGGYFFAYPARYSFMVVPALVIALACWTPMRLRSLASAAAASAVAMVLLTLVWPVGA